MDYVGWMNLELQNDTWPPSDLISRKALCLWTAGLMTFTVNQVNTPARKRASTNGVRRLNRNQRRLRGAGLVGASAFMLVCGLAQGMFFFRLQSWSLLGFGS